MNTDAYTQINTVPILSVLDVLGIKYSDIGGSIAIVQDGKITHGWRVHKKENYIKDFSRTDRAIGSPFNFIRLHLGLNNRQTFERFEEKFKIKSGNTNQQKNSNKKKESQKLPPYQSNW